MEAESRVRVSASGRSARLTGALLARPDEGSVRSEGANLTVTLSGDEWVRPLTPSLAALVLAGLTSEQGEPLGWNAALANATAAGGVGVALDADDGATVLHIAVPALRDYDISTAETISLLVPPAATLGGAVDLRANPSAVVRPAAAAVSGSLAANVGEAEVRASRQELRIDLTADRFAAGVGTDEAAGRALIGGISSTLAAYLSWTAVKRVDDTAVTVFLGGPGARRDIATPETVTVVLPASVVVGNASLVASPSFVIRAAPGTATMVPQQFLREEVYIAGNVKRGARRPRRRRVGRRARRRHRRRRRARRRPPLRLRVGAVGGGRVERDRARRADQRERRGRRAAPRSRAAGCERRSDQRVVVYIGDFGDYAISAPETISLVIPAIALRSGAPILAGSDRFSGPFVVSPSRGTATLTGNLLLDPYESVIQSVEGASLRIDLAGDTWLPEVGSEGTASIDDACTGMLGSELHAEGGDASVWQTVVQAALRTRLSQVIVRESESVLRIELPQLLVYKLYAVETITASVPGACLTSGKQMRPEQIGGIPFSVLPVAGRAYVSGSLLQEALETTVQSKGASLTVTLRDDEFVGDEADFVQKCISGSLKDEPGGWGAVVMEELRANPTQYIEIREVDAGYDIEVDIPASEGYSISEPETISVVIPAELLTSGQQIPASPSFVIEVSGATDVLAGASLAGGLSEADVIADRGPWYTTHNLTITLVNDTWLAAAPALVASRALVSAQAEAHGWNAIIRSSLSARLESDTALTLSFEGGEAAGDGYDISAPETVAVEVPAAACSSGQDVPIVPSFIIRAQSGRASMHPPARELTLLNASNELALVGPASHPLYLTLDGSEWTHDVGRERDATLAVLRSLVSEQAEAAGWNAIVRVGLEPRHVARIDDATLRLTVPQFGLYSISVPETIGVSLPPAAVSSASNLTSSALLVVTPRAGRAFVSGGSLPREPAEATLRAGPSTVEVELLGDAWVNFSAVGSAEGAAAAAELLGNLVADQNGTHGWNMVVAPRLARDGSLRRLSAARLEITIPAAPSFEHLRPGDAPPRRPRRGGPLARGAAHGARRAHPPPRARLGDARRARPRDRGRRARRRRRGRRRLRRRVRRHAAGAQRDARE